MARIIINGDVIEVADGAAGVVVNRDGTVIVGGAVVASGLSGVVGVRWEGPLASLRCAGSATVAGPVAGDVDAGGSVTCGDVGGGVDAGGSVTCGDVSGGIDAGGSVRHGGRR